MDKSNLSISDIVARNCKKRQQTASKRTPRTQKTIHRRAGVRTRSAEGQGRQTRSRKQAAEGAVEGRQRRLGRSQHRRAAAAARVRVAVRAGDAARHDESQSTAGAVLDDRADERRDGQLRQLSSATNQELIQAHHRQHRRWSNEIIFCIYQ